MIEEGATAANAPSSLSSEEPQAETLVWPCAIDSRLPACSVRFPAGMKTKNRIAHRFAQLLEHDSFDALTVMQIADACGVSRQTFYNHFFDKHDLVSWIFERFLRESVYQAGARIRWVDVYRLYLTAIQANRPFFAALFRSPDAPVFIDAQAEMLHSFYKNAFMRVTGGVLDDTQEYELLLHACGSARAVAVWVLEGTKTPIDAVVDATHDALPPCISALFS